MDKDRARIVYLIDTLGMGGAERMLVNLLEHMDAARFDVRVCVIAVREGNPMAAEVERLRIPVDLVPIPRLRRIDRFPALVHYLRQHQTQLLHTQLEFSDTLGNIAARLVGIPSVSTQHTLDAPPRGSRSYWRHQLMWWSLRNFCDRVITVSNVARQHLLAVGRLPSEKVITLYNGIELSRFQEVDPEVRAVLRSSLGLPADAPVLGTIAVLRPPKGIQHMVRAMPSILAAVPDAHYLVVGGGPHEGVLKEQARQLGLAERVVFAGMRDDIPALLATLDVFVLPTEDEALPTVLAEAMAAAKPIVASAVGGVPEMIEEGRNGVLVPPGNAERLAEACIDLLKNPQRGAQMGRTGFHIANERFNIHRQIATLTNLYQQLIGEHTRA